MSLDGKVRWADREDPYDDPIDFYQRMYGGLTRGKLQLVDPALYMNLLRSGRIEEVPILSIIPKDMLIEYCRAHYPGLSRGELQRVNKTLYMRLFREGMLSNIPRRRPLYGSDPFLYYQKHFAGVSRRRLLRIKSGLYRRLRKDGLIGKVPEEEGFQTTMPHQPDNEDFSSDTDEKARGLHECIGDEDPLE